MTPTIIIITLAAIALALAILAYALYCDNRRTFDDNEQLFFDLVFDLGCARHERDQLRDAEIARQSQRLRASKAAQTAAAKRRAEKEIAQ